MTAALDLAFRWPKENPLFPADVSDSLRASLTERKAEDVAMVTRLAWREVWRNLCLIYKWHCVSWRSTHYQVRKAPMSPKSHQDLAPVLRLHSLGKKPSDLWDSICSFGPERSRPRGDWTENSLVCENKPYLKSFQFHVSLSWVLLFFGGLGIKPIALNFVGKCSTTKLSPQPLIMPPARNGIQKAGPLPSDFSVPFTKPIFYNWSARENEICWTIFIR